MASSPHAAEADRTGGTGRRHHGNRHGRSEEARLAVLEAADDLLVERGFAGVTMEAVAARAGVAKQTIYRWWKTKTDVLMDAFLQDATESLTPTDSGDVGRDLREYLRRLAWFLTEADSGAVFKALIGQAQHDPAFAQEFRARCLDVQRRRDRRPLESAVRRGHLPADLDLAAEADQLVGPLYYRVLVTGEPAGDAFTDGLVEAFLARHGVGELTGGS
ncbi:TetR/AcrR family transcriptional regulator [Nonomuraea longispora]|uniref:TetR/AcrR family transcriptional regulator n=1 Tax=Nonomuraea longispora TaxID=1848320 RepID=A0A4R4N676_9ACTN|nr:TetR/AcrR family transcriptional regulator [Nonomuraea longispora]TDC04331.1 TetR/AcrR family transcriptional regulator [Nonomuraea longispora]